MPKVARSIDIPAPPPRVWRWFASQAGLRRWISPSLEIDLRPGGAYRFLGPDEATWVSGTVLEIEPEAALILAWREEEQGWIHPARLSLTLQASDGGTRVTMTFDGFPGIGRPDWPDVVQDYQRGSDQHGTLEALASLVAGDADA